ncbi:MAG: hypothetical protein Q9188_004825, partial [Gyalolechia gomerana]
DGLCAIEVAETPEAQGSYLDLATAADEMNQVCVDFSILPEGSIASNIVDLILKKKLVATVDVTTALKETASWYDIFAATVAITGMCLRDGRGGVSSSLDLDSTNGTPDNLRIIRHIIG